MSLPATVFVGRLKSPLLKAHHHTAVFSDKQCGTLMPPASDDSSSWIGCDGDFFDLSYLRDDVIAGGKMRATHGARVDRVLPL